MPQGRRKTPFSGKQKKLQLIEKKQSKVTKEKNLIRKIKEDDSDGTAETTESVPKVPEGFKLVQQHPVNRGKNNRYALQFHKETREELIQMKEEARESLHYVTGEALEVGNYFHNYDFPIRPQWSYAMSKTQVEANENSYFFKYVTALEKAHYDDMKRLSYFELNIETWRQLWRVLEISDVVLVIVDARVPNLLFPPSLYTYVESLGKKMIMVLNKIDLCPAPLVLAWKFFFEKTYPNIRIVLFTSRPARAGEKQCRQRGLLKMSVEGAKEVYKICKGIVGDAVDLHSWEEKIIEESNDPHFDDEVIIQSKSTDGEKLFEFEEHVPYKNGVLTIGCVGFPNVGKSSLINALMGKKVVSVSRTPGHTKHFQTIFLTNTVRLCDCPGLVFPSSVPRLIQTITGSYPIAQVRAPYTTVKYIAERINLPKLLALRHPEGADDWSAVEICDALAIKRGFLTAKTARPDTYRAANSILRMTLDGKIRLCLHPPGYSNREIYYSMHPDLVEILRIQSTGAKSENVYESENEESDEGARGGDSGDDSSESSDGTVQVSSNPFAGLADE